MSAGSELVRVAGELNRLTDRLGERLARAEKALAGFGVRASVPMTNNAGEPYGTLSFEKVGAFWNLTWNRPNSGGAVHLLKAPRLARVRAAMAVPDLMTAMYDEATSMLKRTEEANASLDLWLQVHESALPNGDPEVKP